MFRSVKRKNKKDTSGAVRARSNVSKDQNSDDESSGDEPTTVIRRTKYNKSSGLAVLASGSKESGSKKKKRRTGGLGFGGQVPASSIPEDEHRDIDVGGSGVSQSYGKEAMDKLRSEQSIRPPPEPSPPETSVQAPEPASQKVPASKEEDFISFQDNSPPAAEGGETDSLDALKSSQDKIVLEDPADEGSKWEEQVAKRAGVAAPPAPRFDTNLTQMQTQLQTVLSNLATRQEEVANTILRRKGDLSHAQAELSRQESTIREIGTVCTSLQKLRYDVTMWVGALRDLQQKVSPIQEGILDMIHGRFSKAQEEWVQWQDDVCTVLHTAGTLDRVLGRQPPNLALASIPTQLDEFGRDIGAQVRRARDIRFERRKQRQGVPLQRLWDWDEDVARRLDILQVALRVAVDDLDESYASLQPLREAFDQWKKDYPEEYRKCYGDLSLAELAFVFEQVEFCRSDWVKTLLKEQEGVSDGNDWPDFPSKLPGVIQNSGSSPCVELTEQQSRKFLVPFAIKALKESPAVTFLSTSFAKGLSGFLSDVLDTSAKKEDGWGELLGAVSSAITTIFEIVSLPSITQTADHPVSTEWLDDSTTFSQQLQPKWVQRLLVNVLNFWLPLLRETEMYDTAGKAVLGFIGNTYLHFLSTLREEQARQSLEPVWTGVQTVSGLLSHPGLVFESAPLRAAARAYNLDQPASL
eukprot:Nitzschia sp. Nitz4//scaffold41_size133979//70690//72771//NITZ4_003352-RA/size133979-processed-gene-0.255-mRNA-1//-1//CDS//3329551485//2784//frame0